MNKRDTILGLVKSGFTPAEALKLVNDNSIVNESSKVSSDCSKVSSESSKVINNYKVSSLYIANIDTKISSDDLEGELKKNFSGFKRLNLYTNFDGTSSGKAQVLFDTFENAQKCMKEIKNTSCIFGKSKLHVTWNMAPILNKNK